MPTPPEFHRIYHEWVFIPRGRRNQSELTPLLEAGYQAAWRNGDEDLRSEVLRFLILATVPECWNILEASIESANKELVIQGLVAYATQVRRQGYSLSISELNKLVRIVDQEIQQDVRILALDVIDAAKVSSFDGLLQDRLLRESDPAVAARLARISMHRGRSNVKDFLLRHYKNNTADYGLGIDLLAHRESLFLTPEEESQVKLALFQTLEVARDQAINATGSARDKAIWLLGTMASDGLPLTEEDAEILARYARSDAQSEHRLHALEALEELRNRTRD